MGKPLIQQRRGKGSPTYQANTHRAAGPVDYRWDQDATGEVVDLIHDPARSAPLARVKFTDEQETLMIVPSNVTVGDTITYGGEPIAGNVLQLGAIPEGTPVCNVELKPGDGGTLARSSGTNALVVAQEEDETVIRLPSKQFKTIDSTCRATVGTVAAAGRTDKPFAKAGKKHKAMKSRGKRYPTVSANAMDAVSHPFGGGRSLGKQKTTGSNASPGQKVGSIGARQTGKKKN